MSDHDMPTVSFQPRPSINRTNSQGLTIDLGGVSPRPDSEPVASPRPISLANNDVNDSPLQTKPNLCVGCWKKLRRWPWSVIRVVMLGIVLLMLICVVFMTETLIRKFKLRTPKTYKFKGHTPEEVISVMDAVRRINKAKDATWTAKYNPSARYGARFLVQPAEPENSTSHYSKLVISSDTDSFDARYKWPRCYTLHEMPNIDTCRTSSIFIASSVMSDRICISTNGTQQPRLSAMELLEKCDACGKCMEEVSPLHAFLYWQNQGLVTGGLQGSREGCWPFEIKTGRPAPCMHPCRLHRYKHVNWLLNECMCTNPLYDKTYDEDKHYAESIFTVKQPNKDTIGAIKQEIQSHGPVVACFDQYQSFDLYSKGIYRPKTIEPDILIGSFCGKVIGWGNYENIPYWTVVNAWGRLFGEYGIIRLAMVVPNEVVSGWPLTR